MLDRMDTTGKTPGEIAAGLAIGGAGTAAGTAVALTVGTIGCTILGPVLFTGAVIAGAGKMAYDSFKEDQKAKR